MKSGLVLSFLLLAFAPMAAQASRGISARSHTPSYRDRTPHVHNGGHRLHHHKG